MKDSPFDIAALVKPFLPPKGAPIAVAVSGGPDSMALCHVLSYAANGPVHALTVDHGLRPESGAEAKQVGTWMSGWPLVKHKVLTRPPANRDTRIQEDARRDRYDLLADYCAALDIRLLFTAHHQDDQAETFLFRLAKGSGLDGLGAIRQVSHLNENLDVIRPFLDVPKKALLDYCRMQGVPYVEDPSNESERFARIRLRKSYDILAREGLTPKRLAMTAARLARAREALDLVADDTFQLATISDEPERIILDFDAFFKASEEIQLRVLTKAIDRVGSAGGYGPRLEQLESLMNRILTEPGFKKTTLGGCLIGVNTQRRQLLIEKES